MNRPLKMEESGCRCRWFFHRLLPAFSWLLAVACVLPAAGVGDPIDFNRDIRPILSENCFYCHGQDAAKREADLRLDLRAAAIEHGAIVPGDVGASLIVDRIEAAERTGVQFLRPDDFDLADHLSKSFGVFHGDEEVEVRVRFSKEVARYVRESKWHDSQQLTEQSDGS